MTDHYDALPWRQRQRILDAVQQRKRETRGADVDDLVRWAVDAYVSQVQDDLLEDAVEKSVAIEAEQSYESGYRAGRADLLAELTALATAGTG